MNSSLGNSYFVFLSLVALLGSAAAQRDEVTQFAYEQAKARSQNKPLAQLSVVVPDASTEDAIVAQKHYVFYFAGITEVEPELEDAEIVGIKGAVVSEVGQKFFGIDGPLSAVLFKHGWHNAKDQNRTEIEIREDAEPGVEMELGIILSKRISEELESVEELKKHVRAIVPVVELPAGLHNWPQKPKAIDLIAANVDSDNYIVGEEHTDLTIDLDALSIQLTKDGGVINETTGGAAKNGQWANFLHQVNWAVRQNYFPLKSGNLIITGALGKINRTGKGDYEADFGELGDIKFKLK